jgi:hypothetical protein
VFTFSRQPDQTRSAFPVLRATAAKFGLQADLVQFHPQPWKASANPTSLVVTAASSAGIKQWPESASELYRPSDSRLSAKLVPTFADRGCHAVSVTNPYCRILGFLDLSRYFCFQVAAQLYSRDRVDAATEVYECKYSFYMDST